MIVFGDQERRVFARRLFETIAAMPAGPPIERHGRLVAALIGAGQVAQALLDEDFQAHGMDRESGGDSLRAQQLVQKLAGMVWRSWSSGLVEVADLPKDALSGSFAALDDRELTLREPEGFAHYAVYPEAFAAAAADWADRAGASVIGIRSIGVTLSAVVAAAADCGRPLTVRPVGHPFAREVVLDPDLERRWAAATGALAIVDEGPGLSGSSFGAVADRLEALGIAPERLAFFPSHDNDLGAEARVPHRARWATANRRLKTFDDIALGATPSRSHRLEAWVGDITGRLSAPLEEMSGGGWRFASGNARADAPPVDAPGERRKFLAQGANGTFLLRFAGLGPSAIERFALQQKLAEAGFVPTPLAYRHGFTVEPWRADVTPLATAGVPRAKLLDHLGLYLGFRATLAAEGRSGASLAALSDMMRINLEESLGPDAARAATAAPPHGMPRAVVTDNRLHRWEWLVDRDRTILKTDAIDHHAGHDLIGCQDIAWDLAGAAAEFELSDSEVTQVGGTIAGVAGRSVDDDLLRFFRLAYPAFQIGLCARAESRASGEDQRRWGAERRRYESEVRKRLG